MSKYNDFYVTTKRYPTYEQNMLENFILNCLNTVILPCKLCTNIMSSFMQLINELEVQNLKLLLRF